MDKTPIHLSTSYHHPWTRIPYLNSSAWGRDSPRPEGSVLPFSNRENTEPTSSFKGAVVSFASIGFSCSRSLFKVQQLAVNLQTCHPRKTNLPPSSPMRTSKQGHSETSSPFWHCPPTSRSSNYSLYTRHQHYNSSNHCVITPQRHFKEQQLTFQGENKNSWIMHQEGLIQPWKAAGAQFMLSGVKQTK